MHLVDNVDVKTDAAARWKSFLDDAVFQSSLNEVWQIVEPHLREVVLDLSRRRRR